MNFHQKPITFVSHVHLKVEDLIRSVQFYKEVVGFTILEQTKTLAKLTADGKNTLLTIEQLEDVLHNKGELQVFITLLFYCQNARTLLILFIIALNEE